VDEEKIDKVVYNLISNALKYSPEKAQIILSLEQKTLDKNSYVNVFHTGNQFYGKALEIKVRDNGKGIKPETITQIFERFFVDHTDGETGTGIGLHICQEYARLHNGHIMVTSEPGQGSTFIINIPIDAHADYEKENLIIQTNFDPLPENESEPPSDSEGSNANKIVLYAEDNDELRIYLKKLLATKYKVLTAKNGQQAFEIASEVIPDIIITDVLMPGLDGMELTGKIRSTPETSDIPIIMLTALSEDHHKIESMKKGVHTFITKPVDESFLMAKIENIFREREALKKKFGEMKAESKLKPGINESFIKKAEDIVENNLRNPSFEISEFASQLSISKSSLQRKIKASTNLNPSEFIRDFRLKKSIELIKQGNLNIDEIALLVGFNSTSYFIRTFKNKYGKTPLAFKAELADKT
jgi:DNA-binding response OmpR family regulator